MANIYRSKSKTGARMTNDMEAILNSDMIDGMESYHKESLKDIKNYDKWIDDHRKIINNNYDELISKYEDMIWKNNYKNKLGKMGLSSMTWKRKGLYDTFYDKGKEVDDKIVELGNSITELRENLKAEIILLLKHEQMCREKDPEREYNKFHEILSEIEGKNKYIFRLLNKEIANIDSMIKSVKDKPGSTDRDHSGIEDMLMALTYNKDIFENHAGCIFEMSTHIKKEYLKHNNRMVMDTNYRASDVRDITAEVENAFSGSRNMYTLLERQKKEYQNRNEQESDRDPVYPKKIKDLPEPGRSSSRYAFPPVVNHRFKRGTSRYAVLRKRSEQNEETKSSPEPIIPERSSSLSSSSTVEKKQTLETTARPELPIPKRSMSRYAIPKVEKQKAVTNKVLPEQNNDQAGVERGMSRYAGLRKKMEQIKAAKESSETFVPERSSSLSSSSTAEKQQTADDISRSETLVHDRSVNFLSASTAEKQKTADDISRSETLVPDRSVSRLDHSLMKKTAMAARDNVKASENALSDKMRDQHQNYNRHKCVKSKGAGSIGLG